MRPGPAHFADLHPPPTPFPFTGGQAQSPKGELMSSPSPLSVSSAPPAPGTSQLTPAGPVHALPHSLAHPEPACALFCFRKSIIK